MCLTFSVYTQSIDHVENWHLLCGSLQLLPLDRPLLSRILIKQDSKAMETGPLESCSLAPPLPEAARSPYTVKLTR